MDERKMTVWQYARMKFACHCQCVLMVSMPVVRNTKVSFMAICPECNERHYISTDVDSVDLDFMYLKTGE